MTEGVRATILVKVEYLNPGGSSKDRIANQDHRRGRGVRRPAPRWHHRRADLRQHRRRAGARRPAARVPVRVRAARQGRRGQAERAHRVRRGDRRDADGRAAGAPGVVLLGVRPARAGDPGAYKPNQYANPNGPRSHYETTGPEIWRDTEQQITHFVAGVGTGGTISGTGRFLKEASEGRVRIVGADPEGSVYSGGTGRPYLVEGVVRTSGPTRTTPASRTRSSPCRTPTRSR